MGENGRSWSPWRHLRRHHPDVTVHECELPATYLGCLDHERRIIWIDSRLTQAEKRCTVAHEIGHLHRGPGLCDPIASPAEERAIDQWAARKLITVRDLASALKWSQHLPEIAEELWVDEYMLRARLRCLTDDEKNYLAASAVWLRALA